MGDQEQDLAQQITSAVAQAMEAQHVANTQVIADAVQNALREQVPRSQQQSSQRTEIQESTLLRASTEFNKQFKSEEIEYFDPELDIENDSTVTGDKL